MLTSHFIRYNLQVPVVPGPCVCCQLLSWTKRLKVHILAVLGETTEEEQGGEAATNNKQHTRSKQVCRKFY